MMLYVEFGVLAQHTEHVINLYIMMHHVMELVVVTTHVIVVHVIDVIQDGHHTQEVVHHYNVIKEQ